MDGDFTTALGSSFQCLTTLPVKKFPPMSNLNSPGTAETEPLPLLLSLVSWEQIPPLPPRLLPPVRVVESQKVPPESLCSSRWSHSLPWTGAVSLHTDRAQSALGAGVGAGPAQAGRARQLPGPRAPRAAPHGSGPARPRSPRPTARPQSAAAAKRARGRAGAAPSTGTPGPAPPEPTPPAPARAPQQHTTRPVPFVQPCEIHSEHVSLASAGHLPAAAPWLPLSHNH